MDAHLLLPAYLLPGLLGPLAPVRIKRVAGVVMAPAIERDAWKVAPLDGAWPGSHPHRKAIQRVIAESDLALDLSSWVGRAFAARYGDVRYSGLAPWMAWMNLNRPEGRLLTFLKEHDGSKWVTTYDTEGNPRGKSESTRGDFREILRDIEEGPTLPDGSSWAEAAALCRILVRLAGVQTQ